MANAPSRVIAVRRPVSASAGTAMSVAFVLDGLELQALNGGPEFHFTEAISLLVKSETQSEMSTALIPQEMLACGLPVVELAGRACEGVFGSDGQVITLANDNVWERTHRAGGVLMVFYGMAIVLVACTTAAWITTMVVIGGGIALLVWAFAYSWRVYQLNHSRGQFN